MKKFFDDVRPALVEARDNKNADININADPPLAAVVIREEAVPNARDESPRMDALGEEERPHTEVEKAPSSSDDYREGSQSNKESGE